MNDAYLKSKKILLVDDEKGLLELLASILKDEGYFELLTASTASQALTLCRESKPDIAVLDVMLPDGDGFSLLKSLRQFTDIPAIFLTAKDEIQDKYSGFGLGADDYITKPFLPREFLFRFQAVLRRCYRKENPSLCLSACQVDLSRALVEKGGKQLPLTAKEHAILETLARNSGQIVTIDALCEAVWGENPFGYGNSLLAHIRRIREKIEDNPSKPQSLITVKGLGYKLIVKGRA